MYIQINCFVLDTRFGIFVRAFGYELFKAPGEKWVVDKEVITTPRALKTY